MKPTFTFPTSIFKLIFCFSLSILFADLSAQTITATGNMAHRRLSHESQMLNDGRVLAFGGNDGFFLNIVIHKSAELYNPTTGTWSMTGSMLLEREDFASAKLPNGNVIAIGGINDNYDIRASCEIYNVATGTWSYTDSMSQPRFDFRAVTLNDGRILVAGGLPSTNVCEIYDPATGTWSATGNMTTIRQDRLALTLLNDGKVLATGGTGGFLSAEIYDPTTGTWTPVANSLNVQRRGHTTILLNDGRVLIVGGTATFTSSGTAEIFSPTDNTFTSTPDMHELRGNSPMVKLSNGNPLIFGLGDFFNPFDTKVIEIYNVATNTWETKTYNVIGSLGYTIHTLLNGKILVLGGIFTTGNGASNGSILITPPTTTSTEAVQTAVASIFPNPTKDYIHVALKENEILSEGMQFKLLDIYGKEVLSVPFSESQFSQRIDAFAAGIYQCIIMRDGQIVHSEKLVISK